MYGYIYKITNLLNNKFYIGKRTYEAEAKQKTEYLSSCKDLKADIKLYGRDNFKKEILIECTTKKNLTYWETYYQFSQKVLHPDTNSYNGNILGKFYRKDV